MIEKSLAQLSSNNQSRSALFQAFYRDERGATAIEYAMLIAMVASVCIISFAAVGGASGGGWNGVANKVSNAMK
jgi:Flp pilus assembly pilin Flp